MHQPNQHIVLASTLDPGPSLHICFLLECMLHNNNPVPTQGVEDIKRKTLVATHLRTQVLHVSHKLQPLNPLENDPLKIEIASRLKI